ncbi:InlB B-repeat-containing protein [Treponema socranskii]
MKKSFAWLSIMFCAFAALFALVSCQNAADELYKSSEQKCLVSFMVGLFGTEGGGTITAKVDGKEIQPNSWVEKDKIVEFTAHPDYGKVAGLWDIVGGDVFEKGSGIDRSDTARVKVNQGMLVRMYFTDATPYMRIVSFGIEGNAGKSRLSAARAGGTAILSGNEVSEGSIIEFTAQPETGKTVDRWFIEGGNFEAGSGTEGHDTARVKVSSDQQFHYINVRVSFKDADPNKRIVTFGIEGSARKNGITAAVSGGTAIASGNEVSDGAVVEFTAVPAPGYKVKSWTIVRTDDKSPLTFEAGGTEGNLSAKVKALCNLTVKLEFERISYTVIFSVPDGHGVLTAQRNWQAFDLGSSVFYGDTLTFTATAEEGYKVKSWTLVNTDDNSPVQFGSGTHQDGRPFVSIQATCNLTLKVEFEKCEYSIIFAVEGEHGSVTAKKKDGSDFTSGSKTFYGEELVFTAVPDNDYKVRMWIVNGRFEGADTAYHLTVTNDVNISVKFKGALSIMICGDERVDEGASGYIDIAKGKTWVQIKAQMEAALVLNRMWQGGDYGAYQWKLNDENGILLDDTYTFTNDTTVYAVTNYLKFKTDGTALTGYNGERPRGRIIISDTITDIHDNVFCNCMGITEVDFSACANLRKIGKYAFGRCIGISGELKLPSGLTEIGQYAFVGCTGISELNFSACTSLTTIAPNAFEGCTSISGDLKLPPGLTGICADTFKDCTRIAGLD